MIYLKRPIGIHIEGTVFATEGDLGHHEFTDAFIEFIQSKGWQFGGGSVQIDEDGEQVDDID
ncbi:hypothetical protein [Paenibacillus sp. UNC496MF]|uniref:hypothetical protein n=1 Tax=Paenibacillus sp. UNC496MF TaxID=1502753 RepID=UPI000B8507A1|nr:hypothetical protein [Paenibacillus sp. UNC496MF]